jgi:hypothetical protein
MLGLKSADYGKAHSLRHRIGVIAKPRRPYSVLSAHQLMRRQCC